MITITRQMARRLRAVFRRSVLGIHHKGAIPPLVLHAEGRQLRAQYRYDDLAVEYVEPGGPRQLDSVPVPLEALADVEGRDDSPVEIESLEPDRTVVRWRDRGIPRIPRVPGDAVRQDRGVPRDAARTGPRSRPTCSTRWPRRPRSAPTTRPATPWIASSSGARRARSSPATAASS